MQPTELRAKRVSRGVPMWDIVATGNGNWTDAIGVLTNLPAERAWCCTVRYRSRLIDLRGATREAVLLALRCAVDAADHAWDAEVKQREAEMACDEDDYFDEAAEWHRAARARDENERALGRYDEIPW